MKKTAFITALILVLSLFLSACAGDGKQNGTNEPVIEYTDYRLAESGETDYRILVSRNAGNMTMLGAEEIASFFKQATYADIEIVTDEKSFSENDKFISIGDNAFSRSAGLNLSESLNGSGYHIETRGKSLFVYGGGDKGNLYGAYDLLEKLFDLEFYSNDETAFGRKFTINVPKLNYTENPDFSAGNVIYTGSMISDLGFQQRTRTVSWESVWTGVGGAHSTYSLLKGINRKDYPDWFARQLNASGEVEKEYKQLCFTNPEVLEALTEAVIREVDGYADRENVMVGIEDNRDYCRCPDCQALMDAYGGAASASVIKCVNKIAEAVEKHLSETGQNRKVNVVMFAYYGYLEAPVKQNADGSYSPIDESVKMRDDTAVLIAPIDTDYGHSYYDTAFNRAERQSFEKWSVLCDSLYLWTYTTNFFYMLAPFDAFNSMQENFRFWKEYNVKHIYAQGQYGNKKATGFVDLQTYLQSKLLWNVDEDLNKLIDGYFENYFKDAAKPMRSYFDELRAHYANLRSRSGVTGGIYFDIEKKDYWPFNMLNGWSRYIDDAYAAIEHYKQSDPALYEKLYDRLCLESIAVRHLIATFYKGMYNEADFREFTLSLKADMARLTVSHCAEGKGIGELPY